MKKIAVGMVLSLAIGGFLFNEAPKITERATAQIEQEFNHTFNQMFATLEIH